MTNHKRQPPFMSVTDVAERLNVSTRSVRRLIAEGKIRIYRVRHSIRISDADFLEYLKTIKNSK